MNSWMSKASYDPSRSKVLSARQVDRDIALSASVGQKVLPVATEAAIVDIVLGWNDERKPATRPAAWCRSPPLDLREILTNENQLLNHNQRHGCHGNIHVARAHERYRRPEQTQIYFLGTAQVGTSRPTFWQYIIIFYNEVGVLI